MKADKIRALITRAMDKLLEYGQEIHTWADEWGGAEKWLAVVGTTG